MNMPAWRRWLRRPLWLVCLLVVSSCKETAAINTEFPQVTGEVFKVQLVGDSRDGPQIYASLLGLAQHSGQADALIHLGDLLSSPARTEQIPLFASLTKSFLQGKPVYIAPGNHDVDSVTSLRNLAKVYPYLGETGYYAQHLGGCFCVFLNSEDQATPGSHIGNEQWAWLKQVLQSPTAQRAHYRAVFVHRPPFPQNHHKDQPLRTPEPFHELMVAHKVSLVASGHEHNYSRLVQDSVTYLITGGGGSPVHGSPDSGASFFHYVEIFEKLAGNQLLGRVIDFQGKVRDEFYVAI